MTICNCTGRCKTPPYVCVEERIEKVERAAEALYHHDADKSPTLWTSWKFASVRKQQQYRDRAEAVLEVIEDAR